MRICVNHISLKEYKQQQGLACDHVPTQRLSKAVIENLFGMFNKSDDRVVCTFCRNGVLSVKIHTQKWSFHQIYSTTYINSSTFTTM